MNDEIKEINIELINDSNSNKQFEHNVEMCIAYGKNYYILNLLKKRSHFSEYKFYVNIKI